MSSKIKLAQIGIGRWGKNLLRNYSQMPEVEVKVVCDFNEQLIDAAKQTYPNLKFTLKDEDIFNDPEIQALVIATQASTHFEIAKKALERGIHVFIEKPIVLKTEDLIELGKIAKAKDHSKHKPLDRIAEMVALIWHLDIGRDFTHRQGIHFSARLW